MVKAVRTIAKRRRAQTSSDCPPQKCFDAPMPRTLIDIHSRCPRPISAAKLSTKEIKTIRALLNMADIPIAETAIRFGVARSMLYLNLSR
jgi:hypothetical protein